MHTCMFHLTLAQLRLQDSQMSVSIHAKISKREKNQKSHDYDYLSLFAEYISGLV